VKKIKLIKNVWFLIYFLIKCIKICLKIIFQTPASGKKEEMRKNGFFW